MAKQSTMNEPPPFKRLVKANKAFFRRVLDVYGNYLAPHDLAEIGIECSDLDLQCVSLPPDVFITPFSKPKLHAILEQKRPFDIYTNHITPREGNLYDALGLSNLIEAYVGLSANEDDLGLLRETDWRQRCMDYDNREVLIQQEDEYDWRVQVIFDKMNGSTPHVTLVLADAAPLEEEKLSVAEMCCIFIITASRMRRKAYRCHRIIPVTVISLSSVYARIVHAYVDVEADKVKVYKSPILDLNKEDYRPEMETLVSWCLGTPTGSTTWAPELKLCIR